MGYNGFEMGLTWVLPGYAKDPHDSNKCRIDRPFIPIDLQVGVSSALQCGGVGVSSASSMNTPTKDITTMKKSNLFQLSLK